MNALTNVLVSVVALLHMWFMALEMYFWARPLGMKTFKMSVDQAQATKVMAMNQGLYNGFLAAGLIWAVTVQDVRLKIFFLSCVVIAGVFGAVTASISILYVQALPALITLILVLWQHLS